MPDFNEGIVTRIYETVPVDDVLGFFSQNIDAAVVRSNVEQEVALKLSQMNNWLSFQNVMLVFILMMGAAVAYVLITSVGGNGGTERIIERVVTNSTGALIG